MFLHSHNFIHKTKLKSFRIFFKWLDYLEELKGKILLLLFYINMIRLFLFFAMNLR